MCGAEKLKAQLRVEMAAVARFQPQEPVMLTIAREVAEKHNITLKLLKGNSGHASILAARTEFARRCFAEGKSDAEIGRFMRRDRTTARHYRGRQT